MKKKPLLLQTPTETWTPFKNKRQYDEYEHKHIQQSLKENQKSNLLFVSRKKKKD